MVRRQQRMRTVYSKPLYYTNAISAPKYTWKPKNSSYSWFYIIFGNFLENHLFHPKTCIYNWRILNMCPNSESDLVLPTSKLKKDMTANIKIYQLDLIKLYGVYL